MALDEDRLREQLELLKIEHSDLDDAIARLMDQAVIDELALRRMKKRKLYLKDIIAKIESMLVPDIIA